MKVASGYDSLSYSGIFCFGKHPSLLKFIQKMNPSKWFIYDQCPGFFSCIFCAFFLQTLWTSVPLCLQYYGIDFCTFPQVLVLLLQCEKNMEAKYPSCQANSLPVPSPLPAPPQYFSLKIQFFPTYFFPVWVTFQMTNGNHLLCKQFLFHPNSAIYQCLCIW